jgi:putative hydrolases of HD superfamily
MSNSHEAVLDFLEVVARLKHIPRTGWLLRGVTPPVESVAAHSYGVALAALLTRGYSGTDGRAVSWERVARMSLAHDLAESVIGDIVPSDPMGPGEKARREAEAYMGICKALGDCDSTSLSDAAADLHALFLEYEQGSTADAILVKDLDKFDMMLQALAYERAQSGLDLSEFFESSAKLRTPLVRGWCDALLARRSKLSGDQTAIPSGPVIAADSFILTLPATGSVSTSVHASPAAQLQSAGKRLLDALASSDFDALKAALAPRVRFRALTHTGLCEAGDAGAAADWYRGKE